MELYIGGYAQGKLEYVLRTHQGQSIEVIDGAEIIESVKSTDKRLIFNHFHIWVKRLLEQGNNPEQSVELFIEKNPNCIIISDEIGNGIVPIEQKERDYREQLGRICIELASKSERVERVICGLGQRLK